MSQGGRRLLEEALRLGWIDQDTGVEVRAMFDGGRVEDAERLLLSRVAPEVRSADPSPDDADPTDSGDPVAMERDQTMRPPPRVQGPRPISIARAPTITAVESVPHAPEPNMESERYKIEKELGRGGVGVVLAAHDLRTGRVAALKVLNAAAQGSPELVQRFIAEARVTAQLEHPGIIPVYDVGETPRGEAFYTMRAVERHSLADVLRNPLLRADFPLVRLVSIFTQVCCAVAYAHSREVVHRDLKPENVLLGDYGEVYVTDWGLARVRPEAQEEASGEQISLTRSGSFLGTPGYMPPEQVPDPSQVDARADVFALGAVLYEILTGHLPFEGKTVSLVLQRTLRDDPKPPIEHDPSCPVVLSELCLRCLAKDRDERPASMTEVISELELFLEGSKERERRRAMALELCGLAADKQRTCSALRDESARLMLEARAEQVALRPWDDLRRKRRHWALLDRGARAKREYTEAFSDATVLYSQALAHDPQCKEAKTGLAELYWLRLCDAEDERDGDARIYLERMLRQYDDGRYGPRLRDKAHVTILTDPPGAEVTALCFVTEARLYTIGQKIELGPTPVEHAFLPGSWLFAIRAPGHAEVRVHRRLIRGDHIQIQQRLYPESEIGDGWLVVGGGPAIVGGDEAAPDAFVEREEHLDDYAIRWAPVTIAEYLELLTDLRRVSPDAVRDRMAWTQAELCPIRLRGDVLEPNPELCEPGEDPRRLLRLPMMHLSWLDAIMYAAWVADRDRRPTRLPTEAEWEKAARGADGRCFPWGDRFDPTFCRMRSSRREPPRPAPIGSFEMDVSPYGVVDMAGGVREWVLDVEGEVPPETASTLMGTGSGAARILRGGSFLTSGPECRCAARLRSEPGLRRPDFGVRLVRPLRG